MAHTVLQLMEKAGWPRHDLNQAIEHIKDALWEIQRHGDIDTHNQFYDITDDQRYYALPSDMVDLKRVFAYDSDEEKYFSISRALDYAIPDTDEEIDSATTGDNDNYLILWG
jgi:hypothetical protein